MAQFTQTVGCGQAVLGVDDAHLDLDDLDSLDQSAQLRAKADVTIGVTHAPYRRVIEAMAENEVDILFAGHTHGGQLCLPGGKALITNCDLPTSQAQGVSRHKDSWLHVSGGMGANIYTPVRLFCPPSATLLTIS